MEQYIYFFYQKGQLKDKQRKGTPASRRSTKGKRQSKFLNVVNDIFSTCLFQFRTGAIAPRHAARMSSRTLTHQYIETGVANHQGILGLDAEVAKRLDDHVGCGFRLFHIKHGDQIRETRKHTHLLEKVNQRRSLPAGGYRQNETTLMQGSKRFLYMGERAYLQLIFVLFEEFLVASHALFARLRGKERSV